MQTFKELDGRVLCWVGFILAPLSCLLNYCRKCRAWDVLGWAGIALASLGVMKQFVDLITDKR